MPQHQVAVIGCGARLQSLLRHVARYPDRATVTALVDPDDASIKATQAVVGEQARRLESAQDLARCHDIDWVMIGSPNALHREHAVAAMRAGKHVFCEKPLATTIEDCIAIRDAAARTQRQFVIGFTLRFSPHYRAIRKLLDEGVVGRLTTMEFSETLGFNHGGFIHQDWRRHTNIAGTHLLEKCSHDIDLANWFVGARAKRVASFGGLSIFTQANAHLAQAIGPDPKTGRPAYQGWPGSRESPFRDDKDIVDHQVAIIEYANGVRATFHTHCAAAIPERRMLLLGDRGAIRADVIAGRIEYARVGWDHAIHEAYTGASGGHGGGDEVLVRELLDVMDGHTMPAATLDDGLASAITCFAIDHAMHAGNVVELQPLWDQVA